jgi:BON domain-containing protein
MSEPLYGSVSGTPIWTGNPSVGYGFPQTASFAFGNVPIGAGASGFGSPQISQGGMSNAAPMDVPPSTFGFTPQPYGFTGGVIPQPPALGFGPMPTAQGYSGFVGQELPFGFTVPQLLTAVAIRRRQPMGPTNDQELEDFIYDALEMLSGTSEVEVRCEGGRVTLTGSVPHKRLKRDAGEIAWTIPGTNDVQNNMTIATRRRARTRDAETQSGTAGRKQT